MNYKKKVRSLAAENLALQASLTFVLSRIAKTDPVLLKAVSAGFGDATNYVENFAIKTGKAAASKHTVKAIRAVEKLRTATLGNHRKPRRGV